ncbi:MAG: hypothetical protein ABIP94_03880 [Planctomycetota bacterium]
MVAQQDPGASRADLAALPLSFVANRGQFAAEVSFTAQVAGATVAFTEDAVRCRLGDHTMTARFVGSQPGVAPVGEHRQPHVSHFYLGADPTRWRSDVPNFANVKYADLYPGIDLIYSGDGRRLKYDFVLAPGVDLAQICIAYEDVERVERGSGGELLVRAASGTATEQPPVAWQEIDGRRVPVAVRYALLGERCFGFAVDGEWRRDLELVIDPVLTYSTYLGGLSYARWVASPSTAPVPLMSRAARCRPTSPPRARRCRAAITSCS